MITLYRFKRISISKVLGGSTMSTIPYAGKYTKQHYLAGIQEWYSYYIYYSHLRNPFAPKAAGEQGVVDIGSGNAELFESGTLTLI